MRFLNSRWRYLVLAAAIHVAVSTTIFCIGHFHLLPDKFDENGIGLTFAIDGVSYQRVAADLASELKNNGFRAWFATRAPLHARIYSVAFAILGGLLGENILAAESVNLLCYLAILICVYFLGREIFSSQTGLAASVIVALWPSFLLHSTQLIRDPLSILCFLGLMLVLVSLISRDFVWRHAVAAGVGGALLASMFWLVRGNMWNIVVVAVALAIVLLLVRMARERRVLMANALSIVFVVVAMLLVPTRLESSSLAGIRPPRTRLAIPSASQPSGSGGVISNVLAEIRQRRSGFRSYTKQASNINSDVQFKSVGDVVRFIPRAFEIGFFAPFPKMWVEAGSFGLASRLLGGIETLAMYFVYFAVGLCVWQERRNLKMWFLVMVAAIGMTALGLVVVNAGALFRIRYVFWIMMIVIGVEGFFHAVARRRGRNRN